MYDKKVTRILCIPNGINGKVEILEGIRKIDRKLMFNNNKITEVILPDSVEEIGDEAFMGCSNLKYITLGKNIRKIGSNIIIGTEYINNKDNAENGIVYIGQYAVGCLYSQEDAPENIIFRDIHPNKFGLSRCSLNARASTAFSSLLAKKNPAF